MPHDAPATPVPPHIAIVMATPDVAEMIRLVLLDEGYDVTIETVGEDACDAPPFRPTADLVIIDCFPLRPVTHWSERDLRCLCDRFAPSPILVCAESFPSRDEIETLCADLALPAIFKPFDIDHLIAMVAALVGKNASTGRRPVLRPMSSAPMRFAQSGCDGLQAGGAEAGRSAGLPGLQEGGEQTWTPSSTPGEMSAQDASRCGRLPS